MALRVNGAPRFFRGGIISLNGVTAVQLIPVRESRSVLRIVAPGSGLWVGDSTLTRDPTTGWVNGIPVPGDQFYDLETSDEVYVLTDSGQTRVNFTEFYD